MIMRPTHLFLDLDGTLTDPREGIVRSIAHALAAMGRPVPAPESLTQFIGPPLGSVFQTLLATDDPHVIRTAVAAYRERFASIGILENRVYQGISEALEALANMGLVLYVVTSKPKVYAERIVEHFGLMKHFTAIYGPTLDDLGGDKTTLIRTALDGEALEPRTVAMVGDRRDDVSGAKANGVQAVAVTWGFGNLEELEGADHLVHSPPELVAWVSQAQL